MGRLSTTECTYLPTYPGETLFIYALYTHVSTILHACKGSFIIMHIMRHTSDSNCPRK